jgi:DNA-binding transcriptional LysR family regulator
VAQQIAALERDLGVSLFVREPQRIRPTPAALLLSERGQLALGLLDSLEKEARTLASGRLGSISIGTALEAGSGLLARSMVMLTDSAPDLEIDLEAGSTDEVLERVRTGAVDLGLVHDHPLAPLELAGTHVLELGEEPWLLVSPARRRAASDRADLLTQDWFVGLDARGEQALRAWGASMGVDPRIRACHHHDDLVLGAVAAGLGIGVLPRLPSQPPPGVVVSRLTEPGATRLTVAVCLPHRPAPAVRACLRALRTAARATAEGTTEQ